MPFAVGNESENRSFRIQHANMWQERVKLNVKPEQMEEVHYVDGWGADPWPTSFVPA